VGPTVAEELLSEVAKLREQGVMLTTVGFGTGSYNDELLEKLANNGDGTYHFVDTLGEARRIFVDEMAATLQMIARNVKIQVEFNPQRVRRYRLIGYENRDIADKDFRNDAVDAGEVGSGQCATALYELELLPQRPGEEAGPIGAVYVRYIDIDTGEVEEISRRIESNAVKATTPDESPRLYLAAAVAEFAEILRESEHARDTSLEEVFNLVKEVSARLPLDEKVRELGRLVHRAQGLPRAQ